MFDRSNSLRCRRGAGDYAKVACLFEHYRACHKSIGFARPVSALAALLVPDGHMLTLAADLPTQLSNGTASNEGLLLH